MFVILKALDIVKQAKVAQLLGPVGERRNSRGTRLGSRESLESMQYDPSDEVFIMCMPVLAHFYLYIYICFFKF